MEKFDYKKVDISFLTCDTSTAPSDNPFFDKKVVFTGDLKGWDRSTAACLLQKLGADVNTSISGRTNIVVTGQGAGPMKLEKIINMLADGHLLTIMCERHFDKAVASYLHMIGIG